MIPETDTDLVPDEKIRKLLLCSGKVYYELRDHRNKVLQDKTVAIVRVEQLHPFPWTQMAQTIAKYPNAEVCWVQEGKPLRIASVIVPKRSTFIFPQLCVSICLDSHIS